MMTCPVRMDSLGFHSRRSLRKKLFLDLSSIQGKRHRRSRLKSWCCETAGGQTDSSVGSAKRVLLSPCSFKDYSPIKRRRFDLHLEDGKEQSISTSDVVIKACLPNISLISCDELADLICECRLADQIFLKQPIILDFRRQSAQARVHIRGAICMPCESCVKLHLLLPMLDKHLSPIFGELNCDLNPDCVSQSERLFVICTDMTPDRIRSNSDFLSRLIVHLKHEYAGNVSVLEAYVQDFLHSYPYLCDYSISSELVLSTEIDQHMTVDCDSVNPEQSVINCVSQPSQMESNPSVQLITTVAPWSLYNAGSKQRKTRRISLPRLILTKAPASGIPHDSNSWVDSDTMNNRASPGTQLKLHFPAFKDEDLTPVCVSSRDHDFVRDVFHMKASQILPFLYIGNEIDGTSEQVLQSCHIRSVLNVTPKVPFLDETRFYCRRLVASDRETQDLRPFFNSAFEFIEESRCSGKVVLVHCQAGVSRSPALVIAYLMAHSDLSLREAYHLVKSKRSVISPNFGFLGQLFEFEADLMTGRAVRKTHILNQFIMDNPPSPSTQLSKDSTDDLISMAFSAHNS
ncbi:hypothetical protein EG68_07138 [Paragonimus skrjabini miyazakii]|uniref:protein-tyrosine-phosphatase n=1 Tax=Paragonimus skrjabini miyazakii TaxID=59628 RepID=A0A8S9YA69_9TREM|nr:hypothetical protein EG68_07138 [Paragonimus skrjabini miyazakii]